MNFEKLTTLLADPSGVDFWSDVLISDAENLLDGFDDPSWLRLRQTWAGWPAEWKLRLAECVTGIKGTNASALLAEMVFDSDVKVALAAAAGLRFLDPLPAVEQRERLIVRIKQLRQTADEFDSHSLLLTMASLGPVLPGID